jgi:hypothetical protein
MTAARLGTLILFGIMLIGGIAIGHSCSRPSPVTVDPLVPKLEAERDSLRLVLVQTQAGLDSARATVKSVEEYRQRQSGKTAERKKRAGDLAATPVAQDTAALRQRADTLWQLYATCSVEVDSLNGATDRMLGAYRQCALAAAQLTEEATRAEGMLNQAVARIGELSRRSNSPWRLGLTAGLVGGLDRDGVFYGPGVSAGATLRVRVPLVGLKLGLTAGGVGAVDLTGKARLGVGAGVGLTF